MLEITNKQKWMQTINDAMNKAQASCEGRTAQRWINAIGKAVEMVETQSEFITYFSDKNYLLVWSQDSNEIYSANGICQCEAYKRGFPCKHRALARLVRNYLGGAENKNPRFPNEGSRAVTPTSPPAGSELSIDIPNAPYLKPASNYKPEKIGSVRV